MALKLKVSNSLSRLAASFCEDLKSQNTSVFQPYFLVTQTEGMNNWLKQQLATHLGIAANYKFLKPNDLINHLYATLGGEFVQPLSAENQSWLLFKILGEKSFIQRFTEISNYYHEDGPDKDLKRMALADKVADLFDQYQVYRPEMIKQWNQNSLDSLTDNDWQKYLWVKAKTLSNNTIPDKTYIGNYILEALKNTDNQKKLKYNIPAVFLFGLSVTTHFHLQIFHEVGKIINLTYYLINPAPNIYWFEDLSAKQAFRMQRKGLIEPDAANEGNTLLTSWGKVMQNTFTMLFNSEELINNYEEVGLHEPDTNNLLHKIQHEIFHNLNNNEREELTIDDISDGSLSIHSAYTPAREVEALYNYLVDLVDKKQEKLSPRDIVVMVSDIDTYAPYIKAVFKNAPYQFYFNIADESFSSNDTIIAALIALLEINSQNFTAENVLQLLDFGYIRKRFNITDLELIRKVVDKANIRFGIEGSTTDDTVYLSWKYGLSKIIYGICISGDDEYLVDGLGGVYPLDMVEGSEAHEIIRFVHFVQMLIHAVQLRESDKTITDWIRYVEKILVDLVFDPGENADEDYISLLKQLEKYNALNNLLTDELNYQVFSYSFLNTLQSSTRSGSFAGGGITFCSLIPMRSIPFKVVALLGLNFDKFPRKENQVNFNLITQKPQKGDRNVKENDKHLFLETLLSAQDYLYISYIGQSVKDNTSIPPSALIDELIDYLQTKFTQNDHLSDLIIQKHPLHSFSHKNQQNGKINYLQNVLPPQYQFTLIKQKEASTFHEIDISDFINFFKNPIKAYYNKVLGIYYHQDELLLSDTELFEIDTLQSWTLKQNLLLLKDEEQELLKNKMLKTGLLPLKNMADVVFTETNASVETIKSQFLTLKGNDEEQVIDIDLKLKDAFVNFYGKINHLYGEKIIFTSWSKSETKYLLDAYLKYLMVQASGLNYELYFISAQKEKIFKAKPLSQITAIEKLTDLVNLYIEGHQEILFFYADFNINPHKISELKNSKFKKLVDDKFNNYQFTSNDVYALNKYRDGFFNEYFENDEEDTASLKMFKANYEKIILPLTQVFPDYYS